MAFETVEVPQGTFVGWYKLAGQQKLTGRCISYGDTAGQDTNGNICPQIVAELVSPFKNWRDKTGEWTDLAAGELVTITCSQASLSRRAKAAQLAPDFLFIIDYTGNYDTPQGGKNSGKAFEMQVDRSAKPKGVATDSIV